MSARNVSPGAWASQVQTLIKCSITYTDPNGSQVENVPDITNSYVAKKVETISLVNGNNTITVPDATNTTGVIIIPPDGNTATLKLKGVNGDTGVGSTKLGWLKVDFDPSSVPANFVIFTSAASAAVKFIWY